MLKLLNDCAETRKRSLLWIHFKIIQPIFISYYLQARHYFVDKGPYSQSYGFSSRHIWMWALDHKESCAPKNWCFWTVVLEKTLESPLDYREIKPVDPKGNQPSICIGRTDVEAEAPILWSHDAKNWLTGKDPDAGKDWGQEEMGTTEDEMDGWHHWLEAHEFEQALGDDQGQGSLAYCSPRHYKELDTTEQLNNNLQGRIQRPPTASAKPLLCLAILALAILIFEFAMFLPTLKQEVDSCPPPLPHCPSQGKAIGDWFPVDWNSKVRKAGQLREETGPLPDHVFLTLEVKRPPRPHMRGRFQEDQWGVMSRDALPTGLCSITHLG